MKRSVRAALVAIALLLGVTAIGASSAPTVSAGAGGYVSNTECNGAQQGGTYRICVDFTTPWGPEVYVYSHSYAPYTYQTRAHILKAGTSPAVSGQYSTQDYYDDNVNASASDCISGAVYMDGLVTGYPYIGTVYVTNLSGFCGTGSSIAAYAMQTSTDWLSTTGSVGADGKYRTTAAAVWADIFNAANNGASFVIVN